MTQKTVFDLIKKQNGEKFAQTIRARDNGIFEIANIVERLRFAGRDAEPILPYLSSLKEIKIKEQPVTKTPYELLDEAGYNAYYADTLEKQNAIRPYFAIGEELCTFHDPARFKHFYIINAVKKNVDQIKRSDFKEPNRQDAYGTSVISIQISKTTGFISIKNRYNHSVDCPDNTFFSNPDNIIDGLAQSIRQEFGIDFSSQDIALPDNYILINDQILNYHTEYNNYRFGSDFYEDNGKIHAIDKDKEIILGSSILNLKTHKIYSPARTNDCFCGVFSKEIEGKTLQVKRLANGSHEIFANGTFLARTTDGQVTDLVLPTTEEIGDYFLPINNAILSFSAPHVKSIGSAFLAMARHLNKISLPELEMVNNDFLHCNRTLTKLTLPKLKSAGYLFMYQNTVLNELYAPNLKIVSDSFLSSNVSLRQIDLPNLTKIGSSFIANNQHINKVNLPKLQFAGSRFLYNNHDLTELKLPSLIFLATNALYYNSYLKSFEAPNLIEIEADFLFSNLNMEKLSLPSLREIGGSFLYCNTALIELDLPNLQTFNGVILACNTRLQKLNMANLSPEKHKTSFETESCLFLDNNHRGRWRFISQVLQNMKKQLPTNISKHQHPVLCSPVLHQHS